MIKFFMKINIGGSSMKKIVALLVVLILAIPMVVNAAFSDVAEEHWAKEICAEPRFAIMAFYILSVYEGKTKLNLQNFSTLMQKGLVPDELDLQKRVFAFNKYLIASLFSPSSKHSYAISLYFDFSILFTSIF